MNITAMLEIMITLMLVMVTINNWKMLGLLLILNWPCTEFLKVPPSPLPVLTNLSIMKIL